MAIETVEPASSMIRSASFDDEHKTMTVVMANGREYATSNIDADAWADFKTAPSPGSWYRQNIMGLTR